MAIKLAILLLPSVFILIVGNLAHFFDAVSRRYRGRSLDYLCVAYFLGQIIVCVLLSAGSCFLTSVVINHS